MITGLQHHVIVRGSYHHPGQILPLVLVVSVNIHQSVDGQTKCPRISESYGEQLREQGTILSIPGKIRKSNAYY